MYISIYFSHGIRNYKPVFVVLFQNISRYRISNFCISASFELRIETKKKRLQIRCIKTEHLKKFCISFFHSF